MMIPFVQSDDHKIKSLIQIRQFLAPPINKSFKQSYTMNEPILQHAVDMDRTTGNIFLSLQFFLIKILL